MGFVAGRIYPRIVGMGRYRGCLFAVVTDLKIMNQLTQFYSASTILVSLELSTLAYCSKLNKPCTY